MILDISAFLDEPSPFELYLIYFSRFAEVFLDDQPCLLIANYKVQPSIFYFPELGSFNISVPNALYLKFFEERS